MTRTAEYDGLLRLLSGEPISRQMKRQLRRAGLVTKELTPKAAGYELLEQYAPRSKWTGPPHHTCSLPPGWYRSTPRVGRHSLTLALAVIMGATAASAFTGGRRQ